MTLPSLVSLGVSLALAVTPALTVTTPTGTSSNTDASPSQVLPLTTSKGDTTTVATSALALTHGSSGGSALVPMRAGILSADASTESDWAKDSAVLTQPLEVDPFMVAGLTWRGGALASGTQMYIRVHERGSWTEWYLVDSDSGSGPDGGSSTGGTDPFVTGGADGVQVRVTGEATDLPADLALQMIPSTPSGEVKLGSGDVTVTSAAPTGVNADSVKDAQTNSATGTPSSSSSAQGTTGAQSSGTIQSGGGASGAGSGTGKSATGTLGTVFPATTTANHLPVAVSSRADWRADESEMSWTPEYASASHVVIHHTAGTNDYTMDQSAAIVRGIYHYHAVTLGWGDIGYNFLVDKWGRAFEGRSGTLASAAGKMAVGAHDQGFNTGTMGISMIGTYSTVSPSQATLDTVGKLSAWLLKRAGVDPLSSVEFVNVGGNAKYAAGSHIDLPRISGHRDTYYTECPGDAGYAQLPRIRQIAAGTIISSASASSSPQPFPAPSTSTNPQGVVDSVTTDSATQTITVTGWAFDTDTTTPINVDVYVDSSGTRTTANQPRADVKRAYNLTTNTVGYSTTIKTTPGTHKACIAAINVGGGTNQWLGCTTVTITSTNPQGVVDSVRADSATQTITVTGWAFDTDTTTPINVDVYVDSSGTRTTANQPRADVKRAYNLTTNTVGYSTTIKTTPGTHKACIAAINVGGGTNQWLGCTTVTITGSGFDAGNIISDSVMFNGGTMNEAAIASFLRSKNLTCVTGTDGTACLKDYTSTSQSMSTPYCSSYNGERNETSAHVIAKAATRCGINPQVLITMLQKEQGLVTASGSALTATRYSKAMGFKCPDSGSCDTTQGTFAAQVYGAASRLVQYGEQPQAFAYRSGQTTVIAYSPNATCGGATVTIRNRATAALYNYTPYQPDPAALANLYGTGDSCSSYGNRNFWRYFRDWFGSSI